MNILQKNTHHFIGTHKGQHDRVSVATKGKLFITRGGNKDELVAQVGII
jgi:hypothetical protein